MLFHNYKQRVLSVGRGNLIAYWPMDEHAGGVAIDASPESNNGAYTGVTLNNATGPDGRGCPRFDGVNDFNNIYGLGLQGDFESTRGTVLIWGKVFNAGVWTDTNNRVLIRIYHGINGWIRIKKDNGNNAYEIARKAGAITALYMGASNTTDWFCIAITWNETADEIKVYFDGVLVSTLTVIGTYVGGAMNNIRNVIGAADTSAIQEWNGWLAHGAIWKTALPEAEIKILSRV